VNRGYASLLFASLLTGTAATACAAAAAETPPQDPHAHHKSMLDKQAQPQGSTTELNLPDAILSTQDGVQVTLTEDVVADNIVVVDFVYTTCTTVCPVLSAVFKQVQDSLDDRLGRDVVLVSITVDPARDTPARLKRYAEKFHARDGWLWLTGGKETITRVLEEFGAYTPNFENHASLVLVGDGRSGQWSRFVGFPAPERILKEIDAYSARRLAQQAHADHEE